MTTSDVSSSRKRCVVRAVHSSRYKTLKPEILERIKTWPGQNQNLPLFSYRPNQDLIYELDAADCLPNAPYTLIDPLSELRLTFSDAVRLIEKANQLALKTESGMKHFLEKNFTEGEEKQPSYFTAPGTIRIFSNELMCYYDGKNWRKLHND